MYIDYGYNPPPQYFFVYLSTCLFLNYKFININKYGIHFTLNQVLLYL